MQVVLGVSDTSNTVMHIRTENSAWQETCNMITTHDVQCPQSRLCSIVMSELCPIKTGDAFNWRRGAMRCNMASLQWRTWTLVSQSCMAFLKYLSWRPWQPLAEGAQIYETATLQCELGVPCPARFAALLLLWISSCPSTCTWQTSLTTKQTDDVHLTWPLLTAEL